jgi:hypothetical protein
MAEEKTRVVKATYREAQQIADGLKLRFCFTVHRFYSI